MFRPPRTRCRCCGQPFSDANVYSEAGWIETRISGLCEVCFDTIADLIAGDADDDERNESDGTDR
ncbi:hypothetical protein LMG29542_03344 [Paraburkholderia humisilvae]|uniref:Uncharacterized protein n=1 Tax=Paraburkholderia humisilvae TaxID=627669 RepID=A0A6J5DWP5_9BURK|nr:hypothetical protein LMG29542_03344 [Paraburkholderia humisilvae]